MSLMRRNALSLIAPCALTDSNEIMRFIKLFLFISLSLAWLYAASLPVQEKILLHLTKADKRTEITAIDWPHTTQIDAMARNIDYLGDTLSITNRTRDRLKQEAWLHAIQLRPLSPFSWLSLSNAYLNAGMRDEGLAALKLAETLGWQRIEYLKPIFDRYEQLEMTSSAKRVAKRVLQMDVRQTYPIYKSLLQSISADEILTDIIPERSMRQERSRAKYAARWTYLYFGLINQVPKEKLSQVIDQVWRNTSHSERKKLLLIGLTGKLSRPQLNRYLRDLDSNAVYEGGEMELSFTGEKNLLCWRRRASGEVEYRHSDETTDVLDVIFSPDWEKNFGRLSCYLPLDIQQPGTYTLSVEWSGHGFDREGGSGLKFQARIYHKQHGWKRYHFIQTNKDEWKMQTSTLEIALGKEDIALEIAMVRRSGKKSLYSRPIAQVTLSDFSITGPGEPATDAP
jgi:hypothetical protein